jgi:ATP-dependent Clp protease protease subunit
MDISVYNSGSVQSIATVIFLAGKRRVVSPHATFMLHRASCAPVALTSDKMEGALNSLKVDEARLEVILKFHLKLSDAQWSDLRNKEFWFTAEDGLKSGVATEIGDFSPPKGAQVFSFNL